MVRYPLQPHQGQPDAAKPDHLKNSWTTKKEKIDCFFFKLILYPSRREFGGQKRPLPSRAIQYNKSCDLMPPELEMERT
jgi:hypothetical protein